MNHTEIIAEIGINHKGQIDLAHELIDGAFHAGADTVKFQTVNPDLVYQTDDPLYPIFKSVQFTPDQWAELKAHCDRIGVEFLSTPGERESVDLLVRLGVRRIKVASDASTDVDFVNYVLHQNKPVILSTGHMPSAYRVVEYLDTYFRKPEYVLHCVSAYPCPPEMANLKKLQEMVLMIHDCKVGYSDHVPGIMASIMAVTMGASLIEKHIKKDETCIDAPVSVNLTELSEMVKAIREIDLYRGQL